MHLTGFRFFTMVILSSFLADPVLAVDFSAPLIEEPNMEVPDTADSPIYFEVVVEDDNSVDTVNLFYRPVNSSEKYILTKMKLIKVGKNKYFVELPVSLFNLEGLDYYVEARDNSNNVSQEPFPKQPGKIYFKGNKCGTAANPCEERISYWGASIAYGTFSVDDPDGDTENIGTPSFSLYHSFLLSRSTMAWIGLSYQNFILPYTSTAIGQDVQSLYVDTLIRWRNTMTDSRVWFGAGLGMGINDIVDRAKSNSGIVSESFANRRITDFGYIVDAGYEVKIEKGRWIGIRGMFYDSTNFGVNRQALGVYIDFRR